MASTQSSAQSSTNISQLIGKIINTSKNAPDVDLDQLIAQIDRVLAHCKDNQGNSSKRKKPRVDFQSSASDAGKISEGFTENVNILAKEISEYSGNEHSTAISVLRAAGNVHWAGLCLLLVAAVLSRLDAIKKNKEERLDLLRSMNDLAKVVRKLKEIPRAKEEMQAQINDSIELVVEGAILCCWQKKAKWIKRFLNAAQHRDALKALGSKVHKMYERLNGHMEAENIWLSMQNLSLGEQTLTVGKQTLAVLENSRICNQPRIPFVEHAVGIKQQIDEVVKLLEWENDTPSVAVIVYGLGGSGKSTLADAVYDSLRDKLRVWKYSAITLFKNLEERPNVEELKSSILQDLTGKKEVRDGKAGQERLKEIIENESTFLYIDNVLGKRPLEELLPRGITNPRKLRLLLTARKSIISDVMRDCSIKYKTYEIQPLHIEDAIQVLCKKIDREKDTKSPLEERPEIKKIAKECKWCPLLLEVVGGFLSKRSNEIGAYEKVFKWMESGEPFSGHKEDRYEQRIIFAYDQLELSAQDAFLDICSYFYDWEWEDVACIVGEEEMKCLEEGALIKRKPQISGHFISVTNIGIHDLLLKLGRTKSNGSRFRTVKEFATALQDNSELLDQTKGLWLTQSERKTRGPIEVSAEVLDRMSGSLRVCAMGSWTIVKGECNKSFHNLRYFQAGELPNLPMPVSKLPSLTYINCFNFQGIISLSQLKNLSNLKVIKLRNLNFDGISEFFDSIKPRPLVLREDDGTLITSSVNLCGLSKLQLSGYSTRREISNLQEFPESLGKFTSLKELYLDYFLNLKQLPAGIGELKALVSLTVTRCNSLQELPTDIVELASLQYLDLTDCHELRELPGNIEKLASLRCLILERCFCLQMLPEQVGNLQSLRRINFKGCSKLSILPQSLGSVHLGMSHISFENCSILSELPEETSWLSRMKSISFAQCSRLERLPNQLCELTGLERLDMRGCRSLSNLPEAFCKLRSLQILNLSECGNLKELCGYFHCLGELKELNLSKCRMLEKLSEDFRSLPSLKKLELSDCQSLGGEWMDSVCAIQSLSKVDISGSERIAQRWIEMKWEKEQWHLEVVNRIPDDGRGLIFADYLATHKTDFLLHNNKKVEVKDLKGKVVLLLNERFGDRSVKIPALKDVYRELQENSTFRAEIVCIPELRINEKPEEYQSTVPWPLLINAGLSIYKGISTELVVLNEKGKISHRNAMPMILRWGIKAYPFSKNREKELRDSEWKEFHFSSQSILAFIFQSFDHFQSTAKEALLHGEMIFVCVGSMKKMYQFLPDLNYALTKLEKVVQVFYVGEGIEYSDYRQQRFHEEEKKYEIKSKEMCRVTSLSFCDVYKFWERVNCLWGELGSQGVEGRTVQVRIMLLAIYEACEGRRKPWSFEEVDEEGKGISVIAVDKDGEMINGRGEEMVQLLCQSDDEEEHNKLMGEIKSEGFSNTLRRRMAR